MVSLGVSGLDDPGDMSAAEMLTMEPPYAFIGTGQVVGFAFRTAYLDLSDGYTPPEVLDQFGFDDAWTGLYLPEIRIFFAPNGAEDFAVNAGVENLLIGLGDSSGITGDFDLAVINQGSGDLKIGARFFNREGVAVAGTPSGVLINVEVSLPETTRMVIDVVGGRAPYTLSANYDGSDHSGVIHDITTTPAGQVIGITATDASSPPKNVILPILTRRREAQITQQPPGAVPDLRATLETTSITLEGQPRDAPELLLVSDSGARIVVALKDTLPNPATQWQVNGTPAGASATLTLPLAGGDTRTIRAILPGQTYTEIDGYFRFDHPPKTNHIAFSLQPQNTSADEAVDPSATAPWKPPARQFLHTWRDVLSRITPRSVTIEGRASFEGDTEKDDYNFALSRRRTEGLEALIASDPTLSGFTVASLPTPLAPGVTNPPGAWSAEWQTHGAPREQWWKAEIRDFSVNIPGPVIDGEARRPAAPEPPDPIPPTTDPVPDQPPPPSWFRHARLKVRIVQDQFVALELSGQIDFQTALEDNMASTGAQFRAVDPGHGQQPGRRDHRLPVPLPDRPGLPDRRGEALYRRRSQRQGRPVDDRPVERPAAVSPRARPNDPRHDHGFHPGPCRHQPAQPGRWRGRAARAQRRRRRPPLGPGPDRGRRRAATERRAGDPVRRRRQLPQARRPLGGVAAV